MKTASGFGLILSAVFLLMFNLSDTIADLKNFHDAGTPQFVAAVLKQIGSVGLAALGGAMLPTLGKESR